MAFGAGEAYPVVFPSISNENSHIGRHSSYHHRFNRTSLPPLPTYTEQSRPRRRWGEDEAIENAGFQVASSGFARCRNNFDACHPVKEEPSKSYDGYMFPKCMVQNLGKLHCSPISTVRRVPRSPSCQVFPRNNEHRLLADGLPVLSDLTRHALWNCASDLYRETSHDKTFRDTSDFMIRKLQRDAQYAVEGPNYVEEQTCSRVLIHPDPCTYCWPNGDIIEQGSSEMTSQKKTSHGQTVENTCRGNISEDPCVRCGDPECSHKGHCAKLTRKAAKHDSVEIQKNNSIGLCRHCVECDKCNICASEEHNVPNSAPCEHFGPWSQSDTRQVHVKHDLSKELWSDVYRYNLPSTLHCPTTQNALTLSMYERWRRFLSSSSNGGDPFFMTSWNSSCRQKQTNAAMSSYRQNANVIESVYPLSNMSAAEGRNRWTYRDADNLRLPCVSSVIGTLNKTRAQNQYHMQHPERIPDLRDNHKYSKRVNFYGYNSSAFR